MDSACRARAGDFAGRVRHFQTHHEHVSGSPGMKAVERSVEAAILDEFREIERLGGVLAAVEDRYQRSQIQNAAHRYEQQIYNGTSPNHWTQSLSRRRREIPEVKLTRTPRKKQQLQVDRLAKFKKKNADKAKRTLDNWLTLLNVVGIVSRCCSKQRKSVR